MKYLYSNAAGLMNLPDRIPSMHAFLLRRMNSNNATSVLKIDYKKLVKNTLVDNGNGSLIAWRSSENTSRRPSLILDVIGNGTADRLWLFTKPGMTFAFDNGWDGKKLLEKDISQLYAMENVSGDRFQVAAVPQLDRLLIGFDAAREGEYVLEFSLSDHFSMNSILLQDLHTGIKQSLTDGGSYVFEAKKGDSGARFRLLYENPSIDTAELSLLLEQVDKRILITNNRNHDCTAFIYSVEGQLLQCIFVKAKGKVATEVLLDGVYVVNLRSSDMVDEARKVMIN